MASRKYALIKIYLASSIRVKLARTTHCQVYFLDVYNNFADAAFFVPAQNAFYFLVRRVSYMAECREICLEFSLHAMLLTVSVE